MNKSKQCSKCGQTKNFQLFYKASRGLHGFDSKCKACREAARKIRDAKNREKITPIKLGATTENDSTA